MAKIEEETWFIGVMAGIGAVILILIIIIIVLCCLWLRNVKKEEERIEKNNNKDEEATTDNQNWTLVQPGDVYSPPSSSNTSRVIRGNEANVAGSSLIHMNKAMRANAVGTQTTYTQTTFENTFTNAQNGGLGNGTAVGNGTVLGNGAVVHSSSHRLSRSESRGSYQKPRITNVAVSSMKGNGTAYSYNSQVASPYSYRIPTEDYENPGVVMYSASENSDRKISNGSEKGKVKEMATSYERRENITTPASPSRQEVELEIRELKESGSTAPVKKRLSNSSVSGVTPQKRVSSYINENFDENDEISNHHQHAAWQVTSGKSTIETRVNRYKKVGAVSVFPD